MAKKNSMKRALLFGATSMALSVSMFVGTTFAWFTDSVTSNNNKIVAGTLKVDLELLTKQTDGTFTWKSVKESNDPIFNYDNWEPGYTDVKVLKVENEGTLALKWKAMFVSNEDLGILADVIDVYVNPSETELTYPENRSDLSEYEKVGTVREFVNTIEETTKGELDAQEKAYLGIALKMREEAGNIYQGESIAPFDITIVAAQLAAEDDSFDNKYDENAQYTGEAASAWELISALSENKNVKLTGDIDLSGVTWSPIAEYSGVLDGNGFAIKNLKGENGLFDKLNGATVKNLKLENVDIDATSNHTGALAGYVVKSAGAQTVIDKVTVSGDIVGGDYYVGGIVGADSNYDTVIKNCVNNATVTAPGQQVGGIVGYATRKTLVENCVNNGAVTGGSFVGGIIGFAAGDDEMPELSITVKSCANNAAVAETNLGPAVTWQGGVGGIIGNVGRAAGDNAVKPLNFYISADCTVLDGQPIYGQKHNVLGGHDTLLNVWLLEVVSNDAELTAALENLKNLDNTVFYATMFELAEGTYAANYDITVAALGNAKGDLYFKAAEGAEVVFTGTTTLGYRNQGVGNAMYNANITYEGVTFDHANPATHSLEVQDVKSLNLINCTVIGDGEYGITSARGNGTGTSKIVGCTFENAGMQLLGNFATGLVIDDCDFIQSCINVQAGNGVTVQNCRFNATITDAHNGESFYLVRSNSTPITVKNCQISIDSTVTGVADSQAKWGMLWNRGSTNWTVENVAVTLTDAAVAQTELLVTKTTSTGVINTTNLTVNGVVK